MSNHLPLCADDCELNHCGRCGCHTVGNTLIGGLCQDCHTLTEDQYNRFMEEQYLNAQIGMPSVFDRL